MIDYTLRKDFPLTDDQNEVVDWMLHRSRCVNSCQTGFGKTYTCCTALVHLLLKYKDTHAIIMCPDKAVKAFKKELSQKIRLAFNVLSSNKPEMMDGARVTIITHSTLKKYMGYISDLKEAGHRLLLLIDESHCLQEPSNNIYKYIASIRHYFTVFWLATATPLKNNIEGLYYMMYMVDPSILGEYSLFKSKFLIIETRQMVRMIGKPGHKYRKVQTVEEIVGYKNLDRLSEILNEFIMIKQKQYNLKFSYHKCELLDKDKGPYLAAGEGLLRESAEDNFAVRVHDLQMVVDNIQEEHKHNGLSSKEKLFLQVLKYKVDNKHPTLVYCDYNDVIDRLEFLVEKTKDFTGINQIFKITGSVPKKQREKIEDLICPGSVVLMTSAGTESINLQRADSLIFYDTPFSILQFIQAVGRVTRIDSKFSQQYIHIIETVGTIDSYKRALVQINGDLISTIFGKVETLPLSLCKADRELVRELKNSLLWCFKQGTLLSEEQIKAIIEGDRDD